MNILNRIVIVQECDATEVENYYSRGHKKYFRTLGFHLSQDCCA